MIGKYKILFARTCSFQLEHPEIADWIARMVASLKDDPRCAGYHTMYHTEHRIHCGRNQMVRTALDYNCKYICFVDGDMHPDYRLWNDMLPDDRQSSYARRWAKPFLQTSLDFLMSQRCGVVAAPAVSGPPANKLNVFLWRDKGDTQISRMTHDECRQQPPEMRQVYAIGTGLMLIDTDVFKILPKPWFSDAYDDKNEQFEVRLSQDCNFCAQCNEHEIPVYGNFASPAGHIKFQIQEPPEPVVFAA